ncbi:MAG: hypothetical protein ABI882_04765 [Acidobacteriota bacterium]
MSLEYAIEYPCEMRRQFDEPTLRVFGRTGSLVSRLIGDSVEGTVAPSAESIEFTSRFSPDLERTEGIAEFCRASCPACLEPDARQLSTSAAREPIGCLGRINYPVDARFERFVADRLQLLYDTMVPSDWPRLLHVLTDPESPFDGEVTKELRRVTTEDGLRFFELRLPIALSRHAVRLTTDCVFDLLSGFGATDDGKSGYQREIPVMALADYADFLDALVERDLDAGEVSRIGAQSQSYQQYVRFSQAVKRAGSLKVRLLLD